MSITYILLSLLLVAIIVSLLAGELSLIGLVVCAAFGLLLGGTPIGVSVKAALIGAGQNAVTALVQLLR
ncbi:hypothetical protein ACPPVT_14435 [Angustibacter sp. McL0619]|uniref:hypothetical protein n=1 Tax=Angustibacter sp. McL0619 TaxID=3415676 RepID=UPI003CE830C6